MRTSPAFIPAVAAAGFGCLLTAPAAHADSGENTALNLPSDTSTQAAHAAGGGGIVRTIFALLVVVAVIYGITWVLKKVKRSKEAGASGTSLESLATLPLGANRALHLVRAGGEVVLLGSAEQGVTPIRRFSEAEAAELGLIETAQPQGATLESLGVTPNGKPQTIGGLLDNLRAKTVVKR
jgi:flagellar protein FliO/FliZ